MPPKRWKPAKRVRDDEDDETIPVTTAKKVKTEGMQKDSEGNEFWELSHNRRLTISDFKGKTLISIREFYEKDGQTLPGKKGISLTLEQYTALVELLPDVEKILVKKGEKVPRPNYDGQAQEPEVVEKDEDEEPEADTKEESEEDD